MRKVMYCLATMLVVGAAGALSAQKPVVCGGTAQFQSASEVSSPDSDKVDSHDRPIGLVKIKLPSGTGGGNGGPSDEPPVEDPTPPSEGEDIPPVEDDPVDPIPEDPPTYFGEPIYGKFTFLLDASGSMGGARIATVRAETVDVIGELREEYDEFDAVAYGSQFPQSQDYSVFMWGALLPATDGNKSAAISWVNGPTTNPGGGTPTYACLKKSCQTYPANLDKMLLLTDGSPNVSGSASQILADFGGWWAKFDDETELIAICIGGSGSAATFMQQLAALAGGTYISA